MKLRIDSCPRCLTKTVAYDYAHPTKGGVAMFFKCRTCGRGWFTSYILEDDGLNRPQWAQHATARARFTEVALGGPQKPSETGSGAAAAEALPWEVGGFLRRISRTCGADWRNPPFIEGQVGG